jgi:pyrimidine operon attenuation protein/uracil phosphoribosyltransferase
MTTDTTLHAEQLYQQLLEQIRPLAAAHPQLAIVGIYSGGAWIAERLVRDLQLNTAAGSIDVSFYRDDYAEKGLRSGAKPSHIPFSSMAHRFCWSTMCCTGRTTRAAINELFDYGRPSRIWLAALVDRGGRHLPVAPDFVAQVSSFESSVSVNLQRADDGTFRISIDHA